MDTAKMVLLLGVLVAACDNDLGPSAVDDRVDPHWVTGAALSHLTSDGQLDYSHIEAEFPFEIDRGTAERLGAVYVQTISSFIGAEAIIDYVEEAHGAPIDFGSLVLCRRTLFMRSPYEPVTAEAHGSLLNVTGGEWLMLFCDKNQIPAVIQQVAARTRATVAANGRIVFPQNSGNDFFISGYALSSAIRVLTSPETAVRLVYEKTHTRISQLPSILGDIYSMRSPYAGRLGALWIIETEHPVRVVRQGETVSQSRFYVVFGYSTLPLDVYVDGKTSAPPFWESTHLVDGAGHERPDSVLIVPRFPLTVASFTLAP